MRPLLVASLVAICAALLRVPVSAEDAEHWLVPSLHHINPGTLYASGAPNTTRANAAISPAALMSSGAMLYGTHCATCHGVDLAGSHGVPALSDAGGARTDFYITTGRMPLAVQGQSAASGEPAGPITAAGTQAYHQAPLFNEQQTAALDAYITRHAKRMISIPVVRLNATQLPLGRFLFENNCEACHGAGAQGATAGYQWTALPLELATPTQIGEAIRIGPGVMPRFTAAQLSDDDIDAVATYVRYLVTEPQNYGGTVTGYIGPSAEGAVGAFFGVGLLFWVVYFTGTKSDGRRLHELDDRDERW